MTETEVNQYMFATLGSHREEGVIEPYTKALTPLALYDLAIQLAELDNELTEQLRATETATVAATEIPFPANILAYNLKKTGKLQIQRSGVYKEAHRLEDKKKLRMLNQTTLEHYYVVDGRKLVVRTSDLANIGTYKFDYLIIPTLADINETLRNPFLQILKAKLVERLEIKIPLQQIDEAK